MWYEETDIIFGLRASISIKIAYFLCYRKIMLASVMIKRNFNNQNFKLLVKIYNNLNAKIT